MRTHNRLRLIVAIASLVLAVLACNRSAPTATPGLSLPTLPSPTLSPMVVVPTVTASPARSPSPTSVPPTDTPVSPPSPTPTPVLPSACPRPGTPAPPERPASFVDYPAVLAAYMSAGGTNQAVERLLREWGAITDELGEVRSLDMTGDTDPETVVALIDPAPEFDLPWPPGDLLIFRCQQRAVVPAFQGRLAIDQEVSDSQFRLYEITDVNGTGRADVVYITSTCGAHTCWDRLYIIEWDGMGFVNRVPDMEDYPYATFTVQDSKILVDVGGIGSAGAGYQRSYQEVWEWDGKQFALVEEVVGPPTALVHYIHDGDDALSRGDYGEAIGDYQVALEDTSLPVGLLFDAEEQAVATVRGYARFKLVAAYAASGDKREAKSQHDLLAVEHPEGTPGYPYVLMGQAFWNDFVVNDAPDLACAAAVAVAEADPTMAERLYAGYANPEYEPTDLCRLTE